jgi:hypothetical protein
MNVGSIFRLFPVDLNASFHAITGSELQKAGV